MNHLHSNNTSVCSVLGESQSSTVLSESVCISVTRCARWKPRTHTQSKHTERHCKQLAEVPGNKMYTRFLNGIKKIIPFHEGPWFRETPLSLSLLSFVQDNKTLSLSIIELVCKDLTLGSPQTRDHLFQILVSPPEREKDFSDMKSAASATKP